MSWWRGAVLYEVYVRSFADSDGDGLGDLPGIRSRLPYLRELGVDGLWITPFYPSPGADHGYDVSDYCGVDPRFGSLADLDALLGDAHALGLRVLVDLVPNHTSIEHPWFREHPERYVWADRPNNWRSVFGGPAWEERDGRFFLHLFSPQQPDLDWHNPEVPAAFERILRFWLGRGVDGIRVDVANGLFKDAELRDEPEPAPGNEPGNMDRRRAIDRPELHPLYRGWRALADSYGDRVLVAEIDYADPGRIAPYVRPDELHLAFNFTLLKRPWDAAAMREAIDATREAIATPTWVLESHDVTRLSTRWGGLRQARAGALLLLALPGTAFLYQGQELGLPHVELPAEARQDAAGKGRDGCRVPIPWDGVPERTWLPVPPEWDTLSVAAQERDPESTLALFRRALALRRELRGDLEWRESPRGTLVLEREGVICLVNVDGEPLPLPDGELLVSSEPLAGTVPAGAAAWVRCGRR
jgi:alpha-glucosidase